MDTDSGTDRDTDSNMYKGINKDTDTDMGTGIVPLMYDNEDKGKDRCRYVPVLTWF